MARPRPIDGLTPETPVGAAAPRILALRLEELASFRDPTLGRTDPEDLHDLRVATRRLRAALRLVGGILAQAAPAVKELGAALGRVRDIDVQVEWLEGALAGAGPAERVALGRLHAERRALLPPREARMREAIARFWTHLVPALQPHLRAAGFAEPLGGPRVRGAVVRRLRAVGRRVAGLRGVDHVDDVHALRIAAKKARYDLELVEPIYGATASNALSALKHLQELLGEIHDRDVRRTLLLDALTHSAPPDHPGLVHLLQTDLLERRRLGKALEEELQRWRDEGRAEALAHLIAGS
jgi:CHAD domain-containing protein